jgi:hypothetical protein
MIWWIKYSNAINTYLSFLFMLVLFNNANINKKAIYWETTEVAF